MKPPEIEKAEAKQGREPQEFVVGLDALAVYVHKDNPLDSISIEELAEIYGEGGEITEWSQLGVDPDSRRFTKIIRVNRQNSSGTYAYFREAVLWDRAGKEIKRDYKLGSIDQSGSKDVVALVSSTPCAIGYSGMGYQAPEVKMLRISRRKGEPGIAPTAANARAKDPARLSDHPAALIYTIGKPQGPVKDYIDWILSPEGQKVLEA